MRKLLTVILIMGIISKLFGQSENKNRYQPDWAFYFTNVDDKLSSITTDLNLIDIAPIKGQENVAYLSIKMNNPREDGLSSNEEADKLWEIEDKILLGFDKDKFKYTYAGRLTSNGYRDLYFFSENPILMEKQVSKLMLNFPNYEFHFGYKLDKKWNGYINFLYPQPRQMQMIQNQRVLQQLENGGDNLTKERDVFHWIYFKTENELTQFENFTKSLGFKTIQKGNSGVDGEYKYLIQVSRIDKVGYNEIDEYTLLLWDKSQELNGEYDGWETSIEQ